MPKSIDLEDFDFEYFLRHDVPEIVIQESEENAIRSSTQENKNCNKKADVDILDFFGLSHLLDSSFSPPPISLLDDEETILYPNSTQSVCLSKKEVQRCISENDHDKRLSSSLHRRVKSADPRTLQVKERAERKREQSRCASRNYRLRKRKQREETEKKFKVLQNDVAMMEERFNTIVNVCHQLEETLKTQSDDITNNIPLPN